MSYEVKANGDVKITFSKTEWNTLDSATIAQLDKYEETGAVHYSTPSRNEDGFILIFAALVQRAKNGFETAVKFVNAIGLGDLLKPVVVETAIEVTPKHDGMDSLRKDLSHLVQVSVKETFKGTMVISISIPNPVQFQASPFTAMSMTTDVTKTYHYADLKMKFDKIEDWRDSIQAAAGKMLERAQLDPIAFFQV